MSSHRREMKGHTDRSPAAELHFSPNSRQISFKKMSSLIPRRIPAAVFYQRRSLVGEKAFSRLKVKSRGPMIRTHRCGASGRLMRAARRLRRRSSLNQYAIEQESSDWLITLVCLDMFIIKLQPGKLKTACAV